MITLPPGIPIEEIQNFMRNHIEEFNNTVAKIEHLRTVLQGTHLDTSFLDSLLVYIEQLRPPN